LNFLIIFRTIKRCDFYVGDLAERRLIAECVNPFRRYTCNLQHVYIENAATQHDSASLPTISETMHISVIFSHQILVAIGQEILEIHLNTRSCASPNQTNAGSIAQLMTA